MRNPEQDKDAALLDMMLSAMNGEDPSQAILRQEARGQSDLVNSTQLPVDGTKGQEAVYESLGIKLGPVEDDLFRDAELPEGWKKERTDHSMWSHLKDAEGNLRAEIFYKAAFYDRSAHMRLTPRFFTRRDYDSPDNIARWIVFDNKTQSVIHTADCEVPVKDEDTDAHYAALRKIEEETEYKGLGWSWLVERYPEYKNPVAYWDE